MKDGAGDGDGGDGAGCTGDGDGNITIRGNIGSTSATGAGTVAIGNGATGTLDFDGTAYFVFQPDEEQTQGAQAMIDDGLFDRFSMDEIYAFHNLPGMDVGTFATRAGTITGSESLFRIELKGIGGHSALPHMVDPAAFARGT